MQTYADSKSYVAALKDDSALSIVSLQMAGDVFDVGRAAIDRQLKQGTLKGIKVGKVKWVLAASIDARMAEEEARVRVVRTFLEAVARKQETTTYEPVMRLVGMQTTVPNDRALIGAILGKITRDTWAKHQFMLSALVFNKALRRPSESFFLLAEGLKNRKIKDRERLLNSQLNSIWAHFPASSGHN